MTNRIGKEDLPALETRGRSQGHSEPSAVPAGVLWESAEFDGVHFVIASYKPTGMDVNFRPGPLDEGAESDSRSIAAEGSGLTEFTPESGILRLGCFWCREDSLNA